MYIVEFHAHEDGTQRVSKKHNNEANLALTAMPTSWCSNAEFC